MEDIFKNVTPKTPNTKNLLLKLLEEIDKSDGEDNINIDIADVKTVLDSKGIYDIQRSEQIGSTSALRAIEAVTESILPINKLNAALLLIEFPPVYTLKKIANLIETHIYSLGDDDTSIIFGTTINNSFKETQIKVTLLINMVEFDYITTHKYTSNNREYI
jgi:cell division protein FtsZ